MYKVCCVIVGVALFLPLWAFAQSSSESGTGKLATLRGNSRPLLIFYRQTTGQRQYKSSIDVQRSILDYDDGELRQRDVVPLYVPFESRVEDVPVNAWAILRRRFHVDDSEFTVVLLGKDGGEKFRSNEPVTIEKLDALIDAMPMRQQEVRDGHRSK